MKPLVNIIAIFFLVSYSLHSFSGNGTGTKEDPFQITNIHELQEMNDDLNAHYILMNSIDASETRKWNDGKGFEPIGDFIHKNDNSPFRGNFNGNDSTISDLYISRTKENSVGLFACIADVGKVQNLIIEDANIQGNERTGIIAGIIFTGSPKSKVIIEECRCEGYVYGRSYIGGFCGEIFADSGKVIIKNSNGSGDVYGSVKSLNNNIGGFCGKILVRYGSIEIENCFSTADVTGLGGGSGGFFGLSFNTHGSMNVIDSYATGDVSGESNVGGFCGHISNSSTVSKISNCYASGKVTGKIDVGGFCGDLYIGSEFNDGEIRISNSYATGDVFGSGYGSGIGGFCGNLQNRKGNSYISNSYATGDVSGGIFSTGGFCGFWIAQSGKVEITASYATGAVSGEQRVGGFCGENKCSNGTVILSYSYSTGEVNGDYIVGGLCGWNIIHSGLATIYNCYTTSSAYGDKKVGGFCGENFAYYGMINIYDSFATGAVSADTTVAGFYASNHFIYPEATIKIENCYSIGQPNGNENISGFGGINIGDGNKEITSCYWDTQASDIKESIAGTGKNTAEMKTINTFENWDFENVWCMEEGETYPLLQYFTDCDALSIKQLHENSELVIYPNPSYDHISITEYEGEISIINSLGVEVWKGNIQFNELIDISGLATGYYIIITKDKVSKLIKY